MAIGETVITIVGNLTADPELRTTGQGAQVASFTIANTPRQYNRQTGQYEDGDALFLRCSAWNDLAQHCVRSLAKGMRVIAQGRLTTALVSGAGRHQSDRRGAARSTKSGHRCGTRRRRSPASAARAVPSTATPHRRSRPSTPASVAGANGRNSRRRHSNPPRRRPMIRGARRRPTNRHLGTSANRIRNRNSKGGSNESQRTTGAHPAGSDT